MTTFLLIRHSSHDWISRGIAGRSNEVPLNEEGIRQSERLADRLAPLEIDQLFSSPVNRVTETARPTVERLDLPLQIAEEITELDFGDWTGKTFQELAEDPRWARFNSYRSGTRIPGGELMTEAQIRAVSFLERLREAFPHQKIALFSHGDIIRAIMAHYLCVPLDLFLRIEISPASISVLSMNEYGPSILRMNDTGELHL